MKIILQDTWVEDSFDILSMGAMVFQKEEILSLPESTFLSSIYFCDTDIVQKFVKSVPDTYDSQFKELFHRNIQKSSFRKFLADYHGVPTFIKPVLNDKNFSGIVISSLQDFPDHGHEIPNLEQDIYFTEPIIILSESRLLVGNNKIYCHGMVSGNPDTTYLNRPEFLSSIIAATGSRFLCVDIALIIKSRSFTWCVLEINPPWSIDDHKDDTRPSFGLPFPDYFQFCADSCHFLKLTHNLK